MSDKPIQLKQYVLVIDEDRSKILKGVFNTILWNQFTNQALAKALKHDGLVDAYSGFVTEIAKKDHAAGLCYDGNCTNEFHVR